MVKKKVLFIGIGFYDYEQAIIAEFEKLGFEVDYFSEVPPQTLFYRLYARFGKIKQLARARSLHSNHIAKHAVDDYNTVFIIKCEYLSEFALEEIRRKNPNANFILYLWDSLKRFPIIQSKFQHFDKIYSFDRQDCLNYEHLQFNPLFFRDEYRSQNNSDKGTKFGVYHLGWYHSDRLALVTKISKALDQNNISYKMILFTGYISYVIQQILGGELKGNKKFLTFKKVSATSNYDNIMSSLATLDIAHADQSGLTMRTIELLGAQKKLITTNVDIVNYDFYNPNNIIIIDRENPFIDNNFLKSDFEPVPEEITLKYSISEWLKRMVIT
jgi:hypothetical protein